jgi:hypothetical protein
VQFTWVHEPFAAKLPSFPQRPGLTQLYPKAAAVIEQLVPAATLVAPLAQFVPFQLAAAPAAIVGTVQVWSQQFALQSVTDVQDAADTSPVLAT